ncbi:MAG: arginine decarboxylase, partial [Acidobacteriota bacterium]
VFQSLPDAWAIDQLFPVAPIQRLNEKPTRLASLADVTCDSDGKIDRFVRSHHGDAYENQEDRRVLELHELGEESYDIAICLVGAYQEILGDLHNLFGDTNTVHVSVDERGDYEIDHVVAGDTVKEVLDYVGYQRNDLVARVRRSAERAIKENRLARDEARQLMRIYEAGLAGYTYLEVD